MRLAPNLHRVGNDIVAVYLVDTPDGVTVIDAGLAGQYADFIAELAAMGRSVDDVRGVVLTHGDTDHIGFGTDMSLGTYPEHHADPWGMAEFPDIAADYNKHVTADQRSPSHSASARTRFPPGWITKKFPPA